MSSHIERISDIPKQRLHHKSQINISCVVQIYFSCLLLHLEVLRMSYYDKYHGMVGHEMVDHVYHSQYSYHVITHNSSSFNTNKSSYNKSFSDSRKNFNVSLNNWRDCNRPHHPNRTLHRRLFHHLTISHLSRSLYQRLACLIVELQLLDFNTTRKY